MTSQLEQLIRPYQREGVDFLLESACRFLADDPGLGKTLQVIAAAERAGAERVLVVAPAIGRVSWREQIGQWASRPAPVVNPDKIPDTGPVWVVCSYQSLLNKNTWRALAAHEWDVLVLDEAHYLKNPDAMRTKAVYDVDKGLYRKAKRVWALSGSPAPNHLGELYPHIAALAPNIFQELTRAHMTYGQWVDAFCVVRHHPTFGQQIKGSQNQHVLRPKLKGFLLRRRKEEVLDDLPDMDFVGEPLDADVLPAGAKMLAQVDAKMRETLPPEAEHWTDEQITDYLLGEEVALSSVRRNLGLLKTPLCAAWVANWLEQNPDRKIMIAAHHTSVIDEAMEALKGHHPVKVDGRDTFARRTEAVRSFQNDKRCRVFVGQITAAGVALTLTAASDIAFFEWSWTPEDNVQIASRLHRIGQKRGALARFLSVPGTLDARIASVAARKARDIHQLFGENADET